MAPVSSITIKRSKSCQIKLLFRFLSGSGSESGSLSNWVDSWENDGEDLTAKNAKIHERKIF